MTMRRARNDRFRARSWAVLADASRGDRIRALEPHLEMPLVVCTSNPAELLDRLPEVDAIGVLDLPASPWMDRIRMAAGGRLVYVTGQFDHPDERTNLMLGRARSLLRELDGCGVRRIGLYGAGRTAGLLADAWADSPVEIAAVFDDAPERQRVRLMGHRVQPLHDAAGMEVDALVVCSRRFESLMLRRARSLESSGTMVVGIQSHESKPLRFSNENLAGLSAVRC